MARKISMKDAINEAIDLEMRRDPSVILMGEDVVGGTGCHGEADAWGGVLGVTKGLYAKQHCRNSYSQRRCFRMGRLPGHWPVVLEDEHCIR